LDHEAVLTKLTDQNTIPEDGYILNNGKLVLGWTVETIKLPLNARLAARVEGKSSLARFGLGIHITAPTIHAGFRGRIRLEIFNNNIVPIRLRAGMRICQLIFELTLGTPDKGYQGQFLGQ
jgi:dCTP deaminase